MSPSAVMAEHLGSSWQIQQAASSLTRVSQVQKGQILGLSR